MCILFFCQSEICQPEGYQLILANNRDELWDRPTKVAHFWGDNEQCISGIDEFPGRVGGTWLGVSKSGKIAVLLNILAKNDPEKLGRGHLVVNYINGNTDINDYARSVIADKDKYNEFNMVLFDLCKQEDCLTAKPVFVSHASSYLSCVSTRTLPANTFLGVSNSPLEYPFLKVQKGKALFGQIVTQYPTVSCKEHLIKCLMNFMSDRTPFIPDPVLERAAALVGFNPSQVMQFSAINVWSPEILYGSRTTTLLLVDGQGNMDYVERTIEPMNVSIPKETTLHKTFKLAAQTSH